MIPIFLAVDTSDYVEAEDLLDAVGDAADVKFGLQFFISNGLAACIKLRNRGSKRKRQMFIDLKFYDIPNTVGWAVTELINNADLDYLTIHACGGIPMMRAAVLAADTAAERGKKRPMLLGVTVLTSDDKPDPGPLVHKLAFDAKEAGLDGLVCSAHEVNWFRNLMFTRDGNAPFLMVPGIRLNVEHNDQKRVATPREAMDAGASALVIGREITQAKDPKRAIGEILLNLRTDPGVPS